jgi:alkylated DNA repair dioxygenase AlkB
MVRNMQQSDLFAGASLPLPAGMSYREAFLSERDEASLLSIIQSLPLTEAKYRQYTARRRTISYGAGYDFTHQKTTPAPPLPAFLDDVRSRAAAWAGIEAEDFVHALIAEYQPGTPLGWHRDVPDYEVIVGISLASAARMRFRPYPWTPERRKEIFAIELARRSAYILRGAARWQWQHSVPPVKVLRYSITFRTARQREHSRADDVASSSATPEIVMESRKQPATPAKGDRTSPSHGDDPGGIDRKLGPRGQREKEEKAEPRTPEDPPPNNGLFEG